MKTYKECKDEVLEDELGLTWDDWMSHHELPKGDLVTEYEQRAADMYAAQFHLFSWEPTEEQIMAEALSSSKALSDIQTDFVDGFHYAIDWCKKQINR